MSSNEWNDLEKQFRELKAMHNMITQIICYTHGSSHKLFKTNCTIEKYIGAIQDKLDSIVCECYLNIDYLPDNDIKLTKIFMMHVMKNIYFQMECIILEQY